MSVSALRLLLSALLFLQTPFPTPASPKLLIEAPPELAAVRTRLQSIEGRGLDGIMRLTGVSDPGRPIHVILAPEHSDIARATPAWIAGFAAGASDAVVLFPARSPTYPDDTLDDVLRHEVAHVLIWRASGGRPIPRWFNEGLAMAAERQRGLGDQTQLLYQLVTGSRTNLDELDRLFSGGRNDQTRAYALAGAIVHDVLQRYGSTSPAQILLRVGRGIQFDRAFFDVTGVTPEQTDAGFWDRQRIWTTWVPIVASSTTVWLAITLLAILAIYIRRRKNRKIEERWAEDGDDIER